MDTDTGVDVTRTRDMTKFKKKGYKDMVRNILLLLYINKFIKSQSSDQQTKIPINMCTNYKISQVCSNITTT